VVDVYTAAAKALNHRRTDGTATGVRRVQTLDIRQAGLENRERGRQPRADAALQVVLDKLISGQTVRGTPEWEAVGAHVLSLAERDARLWPTHPAEYVGAYAMTVVEFFLTRPKVAASAAKPWGLAVIKGRLAARTAVGAEALCGLTCRDPLTHRTRLADVPRIVSLDRQIDVGG
jgi:hypothetical protein